MAFNLNTIELGKTLGLNIKSTSDYKDTFVESEELGSISLVPINSLLLNGSVFVYTNTLQSSNIVTSWNIASSTVDTSTVLSSLLITSNGSTVGTWGALTAAYEQRNAQSFTLSSSSIVTSVSGYFAKYNSPTDSMRMTIQTDSSGSPSGSVVTGYTTDTSNTSFSTNPTFTLMNIPFTSSTVLSPSTLYWVVVDRTGAHSDTNQYQWYYNNSSNDYSNGSHKMYYAGAWNTVNYDARLNLSLSLISSTITYSYVPASTLDVYPFVMDHPSLPYGDIDGATTYFDGDFRTTSLYSSLIL